MCARTLCQAGGVVFPVLLLLGILVFFLVSLMFTGWKLFYQTGYVCLGVYVGFLIYVFVTKMAVPNI